MAFYAKALVLNVRVNTRAKRVIRGDDGSWHVTVEMTASSSPDEATTKTLRAKDVVFATGNSSKPRLPSIPGQFSGRILHSSQYWGGRAFADRRIVVIGSNNSGFDIAQDLWEQGAKSVTMIQRSPSMVVSTESVLKHGLGPLYRQDAPLHHDDADLVATATPYKLLMPRWKAVTQKMQDTDKDFHRGLINAGYKLDHGPEGMGIFSKSATEGGGFYIDMGCAGLLIRGDVSIRYATVSRFEGDSVVILDKRTQKEGYLDADAVVCATGFDTMNQWLADLCGEEIASSIGRTWGLGLGIRQHKDPGPWEGELRNMWKPTTVERLWFHGGNLAQSRSYSRVLALQLCKRFLVDEAQGDGFAIRDRVFRIQHHRSTSFHRHGVDRQPKPWARRRVLL